MKRIALFLPPLAGVVMLSLVAFGAPDTASLAPLKVDARYTPDKSSTPETAAFFYMRGLALKTSSLTLDELRTNINRNRVLAQNQKRRGARLGQWVGADEFRRHRQTYTQLLKDASDALRPKDSRGKPAAGSNTLSREAQERKLRTDCIKKLDQAAQSWPDATIRGFLMGLAYLQSVDTQGRRDKVGAAETAFKECIERAPRVAGFHQARGEALAAMSRHLDATAEFTLALRLAPDSRQARERLNTAMNKVPGGEMSRTEYKQAKEVYRAFEGNVSGGGAGGWSPGGNLGSWLVPGKGGRSWSNIVMPPAATGTGAVAAGTTGNFTPTLPTPPYDRLMFRQAVGVPVGKNLLLLDGELVKDALEITVQIDDRTIAVAKVNRTPNDAKAPPLAVISVTGYEFTPLGGDRKTAFKAPVSGRIYATNAYEEMGMVIREMKFKASAMDKDGNLKIAEKLWAGESAGAVVADDGTLAGFLAGKTDVTADDGGPDRFYPLKDILPLMGGGGGGWTPPGGGSGSNTKATPGKAFLVHILVGETF